MPSPYKHHLEHASLGQYPKPQAHELLHISFDKLHLRSQSLSEKKVKQFEELARNFAEQDTIDGIVNWSEYLWEQLKDEQLIDEYNAWSEEYFKPQPPVDNIVKKDPEDVLTDFKNALRHADWNTGNESLKKVSSMMLYGRRLNNKGLFVLGTYQKFWLVLRLQMWAISPQKTDLQLRELYGVAEGQPGGVLGLRYKPIRDDSTASVLFFFPLGK